jgi:hypothetical protein
MDEVPAFCAGDREGIATMKLCLAICVLAVSLYSGMADAHGRGGRGGGHLGLWIGAPIVIGAPYYYYPPPYYRYGPPVVREYSYEPAPSPPVVVTPQSSTWYYCRDSRAYYPYVHECPGGWDSVPARPPEGE